MKSEKKKSGSKAAFIEERKTTEKLAVVEVGFCTSKCIVIVVLPQKEILN